MRNDAGLQEVLVPLFNVPLNFFCRLYHRGKYLNRQPNDFVVGYVDAYLLHQVQYVHKLRLKALSRDLHRVVERLQHFLSVLVVLHG